MQFTTLLSTAVLSGLALAAPAKRADAVSMASTATPEWTIQTFTRTCDSADTSCKYSFNVLTNNGTAASACSYTAKGSPASRASVSPLACGPYQVSSNWSGQFGAGNGFTTLAVTNGKQIVYPSYEDKVITNGKPVSPDRSYPVYNINQ